MKTRTIKLTLEQAKEFYKKEGEFRTLALSAYTKEELTKVELPKTWEEFCKQSNPTNSWRYCIPSKYVAAFKLEQLRDCYRQGWVPDYTTGISHNYSIVIEEGELRITYFFYTNMFLSFQSKEVAEEFLKNFKPLIEQAGDLI